MLKLGRLAGCGILSLVALCGCNDQDAERIGRVGGKAFDKANELTNDAGDKIGLSIRNAKSNLEVPGRVQTRLKWDQGLQGAAIKVGADKEGVTLSGTVKDEFQRRRAIELAETTIGVTKVTDKLETTVIAREQ